MYTFFVQPFHVLDRTSRCIYHWDALSFTASCTEARGRLCSGGTVTW